MLRNVACVLLLALVVSLHRAHGHALWQQVVRSEKSGGSRDGDDSLTTVITFAEKPGLANVPPERMATMALDKGLYTYVQGADDGFYPVTQLYPRKVGKILVAELPQRAGNSYALESFFAYGLYDGYEEGAPPKYSVFYTSAPNDKNGDPDTVFKTVRRLSKMRVDLTNPRETKGGDDVLRVGARVLFDGQTLTNTNNNNNTLIVVRIMNATGDEIDAQPVSPDTGLAHFVLPSATLGARVFAKVAHDVDTPGSMTRDGQRYDTTSYYATTVLELVPDNYAAYPDADDVAVLETTVVDEDSNENDNDNDDGFGTAAILGIVLCVSFLSGIVSAVIVYQAKRLPFCAATMKTMESNRYYDYLFT